MHRVNCLAQRNCPCGPHVIWFGIDIAAKMRPWELATPSPRPNEPENVAHSSKENYSVSIKDVVHRSTETRSMVNGVHSQQQQRLFSERFCVALDWCYLFCVVGWASGRVGLHFGRRLCVLVNWIKLICRSTVMWFSWANNIGWKELLSSGICVFVSGSRSTYYEELCSS